MQTITADCAGCAACAHRSTRERCAAPSPAAIGFRRLAEPDPYDGNAAGFDAVLYTVEAECEAVLAEVARSGE